jgi:hypothetical protein
VLVAGIDHGGRFAVAWDGRLSNKNDTDIPRQYDLLSAYPNPFNCKVTVEFDLSQSGDITLSVYDLGGRRVAVLVKGYKTQGRHLEIWDGENHDGVSLPSGLYWARLETQTATQSIKLLLLR